MKAGTLLPALTVTALIASLPFDAPLPSAFE